jgi:phospholipase A1
MHAVFVIPGIMGTELFLPDDSGGRGEKVWPPRPLETQLGYRRREKLADRRVIAGDIIANVLCFDFYQPLLDLLQDLGFTTDGADQRLVPFPYDWRRDLFDIAAALAVRIEETAPATERISLVGHSMGGLIARLLLESPDWRNRDSFRKIDQFVAIAVPHLGAPLALGRILGVDSALGISGEDFAWLASREEFPSAYQLLPAPGDAVCWNQTDRALGTLDIYGEADARSLGLNPRLLERARAVHRVLGANAPPAHVRYFYFAASGHRTPTRINVFRRADGTVDPSQTQLTRTADGGDGTVPIFSALPRLGQRHIATNEHATAFKGDAFRRVFVRLFGGDEGSALEGVVLEAGAPRLALSIEAPVVTQGQDVEVLLHAVGDADDPHGALPEIKGDLVLTKVRDGEAIVADEEVRRVPVAYAGPPLNRLRLYLAPIDAPGHYQLHFEGVPGEAGPEPFAVCAPLPVTSTRTP